MHATFLLIFFSSCSSFTSSVSLVVFSAAFGAVVSSLWHIGVLHTAFDGASLVLAFYLASAFTTTPKPPSFAAKTWVNETPSVITWTPRPSIRDIRQMRGLGFGTRARERIRRLSRT